MENSSYIAASGFKTSPVQDKTHYAANSSREWLQKRFIWRQIYHLSYNSTVRAVTSGALGESSFDLLPARYFPLHFPPVVISWQHYIALLPSCNSRTYSFRGVPLPQQHFTWVTRLLDNRLVFRPLCYRACDIQTSLLKYCTSSLLQVEVSIDKEYVYMGYFMNWSVTPEPIEDFDALPLLLVKAKPEIARIVHSALGKL